jgi:tetratricopeptide (TPR) repeat protein
MKKLFGSAIAVLLLSLPAQAQTADDCYKATLKDDDAAIIRVCTQALEKGGMSDEDRSITLSNRGLGFLRSKQFDKSIIDFSEALLINPKNAYSFNFRGEAWREKGNFDRALTDFEEALAIDPGFTGAYLNRGLTFEKQGNANAARAEYQKAISQTGTRELDKWARTQAQQRLTALGGNPQQQQQQQTNPRIENQERGRDSRTQQDDRRDRPQQQQTNPGRGSEGGYQRRN